MPTSDAVQREADWLAITDDALPPLLAPAGPWGIVQAYWPRTPNTSKTGIYVLRRVLDDQRFDNVQLMPQYEFMLKLVWPVRLSGGSGGAGLAETAQQNFDDAIDLLIQRIRGLPQDKTHGGRFLSVGEAPRGLYPSVSFEDPEATISANAIQLRASVTYRADDFQVYG